MRIQEILENALFKGKEALLPLYDELEKKVKSDFHKPGDRSDQDLHFIP